MGKRATPKRGRDGNKPARPQDRERAAESQRQGRASRDAPEDVESPAVHFKPPLEPRRGLLIALSAVFALWIGFLLFLYFKTEYGHGLEQHAVPHATPPGAEPTR